MASSFLIYHPDVPKQALVTTTTTTPFDPDYPQASTVTGPRSNYGQLAVAGSSMQVVYDLGTGFSRTVDHFALAGVKALKAAGVLECRLQTSSDGATWTDTFGTAAGFQTRTFLGPDGQDLLFTYALNNHFGSTPGAYRYFRTVVTAPTASKYPVSKVMFGEAFDMGQEPGSYDLAVEGEDAGTWRYPRGQVLMTRTGQARHQVTVEWDGVPDAKAAAFDRLVVRPAARDTVLLSTSTYLDPLFDNRLLHCKLLADQTSITRRRGRGDWNDIKTVWREEL